MSRLWVQGAVIGALVLCFSSEVQAAGAQTFRSEAAALAGCDGDGVVWVSMADGQYVRKGSPAYGKGTNAAFACEAEIIRAGGTAVATQPMAQQHH